MEDQSRREAWFIFLSLSVATTAWVLIAGKDMSWDFLNHQLYLPFSLLTGRFGTDLLAAGPQSYQNPVGYLPMYGLVRSNMPAWMVAMVLALAITAMQAWAMVRTARQVFGQSSSSREWRFLAIALSFAAPVHMLLIGGTSNDPLCAALTLIALAIVLDPAASLRAVAMAGLATGLAIAIKPTSLVFGLPTAALAMVQVASRRWTLLKALQGVLWAVLAFAVVGGLWAYWLWIQFGNPTYPLLNQLFESPLAPTGATVSLRFLPQTAWDWLLRPLQVVQFKSFVTVEAFAPDLRPAAALFATVVAAVLVTRRHGLRRWLHAQTWLRADVQLVVFLALSYVLWMATSGNARYAIPWFMLSGLVLVRSVQHLWHKRLALMALLVLLGVQLIGYVGAGDRRLSPQPWGSGPYASFAIPNRLTTEPVLHLSLGVQSYAGLAPYLHHAGAFINLRGQMSLPNQGPLADLLNQELTRWKGRTRFLFAPRFAPGSKAFAASIEGDNWLLSRRYGLRIDTRDCEMIRILGPGPDSGIGRQKLPMSGADGYTRRILSCAAISESIDDPHFARDLAFASRVFDLLESNCPLAFGPHPMTTDANPAAFWRLYMNSGAVIEISKTQGVVASFHRASEPIYLGTAEHVIENGGKDACIAWNKLLAQ